MHLKSLLMGLTVSPLLLGASEPMRMQPSSKWVVDYADDSCRLIRVFGEGDTETKLAFQGVAPNEMTMLLVGGTLRSSQDDADVEARFLPGTDEPFKGTGATAEGGKKGAAFWSSIPLSPRWRSSAELQYYRKNKLDARSTRPVFDLAARAAVSAKRLALAASTTEISVRPSAGRAMVLETGSLAKPLTVFDECERDLLRQWGVDPAVEDKIVKPVWAPSVLSWFDSSDYPTSSLGQGEQSTVNARLAVDSSGKVTKCVSVSAYNAPAFNKVVCDVLRSRARFFPAELADGTKVSSYYSQNITFKMP